MIALSVAAALAVFILYTSIAGAGTPQIEPSSLAGHTGEVELVGTVVGPVRGDAHTSSGMTFRLKDTSGQGAARATVRYRGDVPDLFKTGRRVVVTGTLRHGTFVANRNSLTTKCPSKYAPAKSST